MRTVVINALNSSSGGGRSIRDSLLKLLDGKKLEHRYVVMAPPNNGLNFISNENIEIMELPSWMAHTMLAPVVYRFLLKRWLEKAKADMVFNLGDLIIHTKVPQLYLFDWPYALDVHPKVWAGMSWRDWLNRRLKLVLVQRYIQRPDIVIAQTDCIKSMLEKKYGLKDVRVINNAVTRETGIGSYGRRFDLPEGRRLLYPALYYPHKNHEILLDVAKLIKQRRLDYYIIITVSPSSSAAQSFLDTLERQGLEEIIINIGQLPLADMKSLYEQCDALLMPTLLESFSISYIEAMEYGLPIFTSDMWFARSVCGKAAAYFDPLDGADILRTIENVLENEDRTKALIDAGRKRLEEFPTWEKNLACFEAMLEELLEKSRNPKDIAATSAALETGLASRK